MYFYLLFTNQSACICRYNGLEGTHIKVTDFVRDMDCLVCGPGTLIELDTSVTLSQVISNFSWVYFC